MSIPSDMKDVFIFNLENLEKVDTNSISSEDLITLHNLKNKYKILINICEIDYRKNMLYKKQEKEKIPSGKHYYNTLIAFEYKKTHNLLKNLEEIDINLNNSNNDFIENLYKNGLKKTVDINTFLDLIDVTTDFDTLEQNVFKKTLIFFQDKYGVDSSEVEGLLFIKKSFYPEDETSKLPTISEFEHFNDIPPLMADTYFVIREIYRRKSWAVLTHELLTDIINDIKKKNVKQIIDIGSGSGALIFWIRRYLKENGMDDIKVVGIDDNSWGMGTKPMVNDIVNGDITAVKDIIDNKLKEFSPEELYFTASWLTHKSEFGFEFLKYIPVNSNLLHIGEGTYGATGTPALRAGLEFSSELDETSNFRYSPFQDINDFPSSYIKQRDINEQTSDILISLGDDYSNDSNENFKMLFLKFLKNIDLSNVNDDNEVISEEFEDIIIDIINDIEYVKPDLIDFKDIQLYLHSIFMELSEKATGSIKTDIENFSNNLFHIDNINDLIALYKNDLTFLNNFFIKNSKIKTSVRRKSFNKS
jgi:hypothetical protein